MWWLHVTVTVTDVVVKRCHCAFAQLLTDRMMSSYNSYGLATGCRCVSVLKGRMFRADVAVAVWMSPTASCLISCSCHRSALAG